MLIGYQFDTYAEKRNIIGIVPDAKYKKIRDIFILKEGIGNKLNRLANRKVLSRFNTKNPRFNSYNQSLGEVISTTKEGRFFISKLIRKGIGQAVHEIFAARKVILEKSIRSISRIIEHHSIEDYASRLKNIYLEAIRADKT
ncbi:hypothetical protein [Dendronalium sp. ChiSLP03b]|uniref:hypothetical protein n=1 Tax=Dendronalium sp. ChiSLP03b TaxID=3075381 RepID=UPI002AD23113|nr:hypothetical protein [Dendronalium sp. ChiSLP03b]MDZ8207795.1 hypothetical protein [Dendronalium sp. ChiSLP03b]